MKLSATFIGFAWDAHGDCLRHRKGGSEKLAQWYEGRRSAYLFAAKMCRDEDRKPTSPWTKSHETHKL